MHRRPPITTRTATPFPYTQLFRFLVGIEITDDAIPLPSFHHPRRAAYVLGRERGSLSDGLLARCDHVVRIPSRFSINLAIAGAMVMYDRMLCMGLFAPRPHRPGAQAAPVQRSEERRVGKEGGSTGRSRGSPLH